MLAYKAMEEVSATVEGAVEENENTHHNNITHKLIEKCVKTYKCHRSAIDTDLKFCQELQKDVGKEGVKYLQAVVKKMKSF